MIHNDIPIAHQEKLQSTISPFSHFASLEFIYANHALKGIWDAIPDQHHYSCEVLYKLIAPSLFPQYDKIIISDVDVIFLNPLIHSFLEFDPHQEHLIGGVLSNNPQDFFKNPFTGYRSKYKLFSPQEQKALQYGIAGGYLIINLLEWRKQDTQKQAITCLKQNAHKIVQAEQDILSLVCYPYISKISLAHIVCHTSWRDLGESWERFKPNIYTQEEINQARDHPIQLHYAGAKKPWNTPNEPKSEIWFSYLCKTPFLRDYLDTLEIGILQKHQQQTILSKVKRKIKKCWTLIKAKF